MRSIVISLLLGACMVESADEAGGRRDIQGVDDRKERFDIMGSALERAALASVAHARGPFEPKVGFQLQTKSLATVHTLCSDERFGEQPVLAGCSGTLIDDDLVVTAGHCLAAMCATNTVDTWIFDFAYDKLFSDPNAIVSPIPGGKIYTCKAVELHAYVRPVDDYAIVRLDRPVTDRTPARIATASLVAGDAIAAIGHPQQIPQKISPGVVSKIAADLIYANADILAGNSGGGLFNSRGELAGVVVRAPNPEYEATPDGCKRAVVCPNNDCPSPQFEPIAKILARAPDALAAEIARSQALLPQ